MYEPLPRSRAAALAGTVAVVGIAATAALMPMSVAAAAPVHHAKVVRLSVAQRGSVITTTIRTTRSAKCDLTVTASTRSARFGVEKVSKDHKLVDSWAIPTDAPSGRWTFTATCKHAARTWTTKVRRSMRVSGTGTGALVENPRAQASAAGGRGGGNQSCAPIESPANGGTVCFIGDPFAIYQDGTDVGQCTWYAAGMRPDLDGIDTGNAADWLSEASGKKSEGTTPEVGAIAVNTTADGGVGHVAYVAGVQDGGSQLLLDEANLHNDGGVFLNILTPASEFQGYIYSASSTPPAPTESAPPASSGNGATEVTGGPTNTWSNPSTAGGNEGATIASYYGVNVTCRLSGFQVADGNTWWYEIASSPWNNSYYASADAFYNNGQTSGSLNATPFVDTNVPICSSGSTAPSSPPVSTAPSGTPETTGGVTHTWTDYSDAGGNEGQSIPSNATVTIACKVTGFQVADGNTWWYRIASSPWNGSYYASADAFYNNGETSGSLHGTPFVDSNVPNC